ncbi:hypothetical protein CVT24_000994 [Panaeolus cyanescens]|uniref:F-box domain-containing protein n=1 Tax=Panaeolus cyanescens TaxID=181874 RepID=A0A409YCG6_9AGAR|nr:hypothetical protein CVT24_000994 [Panaeolus cyanescens]
MHKVLQNPFILRHIFEQLESWDVGPCCYNSALVCRAFYDPCQDVLWRDLQGSTLLPVFKLLSNLHHYRKQGVWALSGAVSPSDLEKLQIFGRRVRIYYAPETEDNIDPSVYILVSNALRGNPLFPNIQSVHFSIKNVNVKSHAASLSMLFSPNLRKVTLKPLRSIGLFNYSVFVQRLIAAPQVTYLHLAKFPLCQESLDIILSLKNLASLALDLVHSKSATLNRTTLASLANLERLSSLIITMTPADWVTADSEETQLCVFPQLRTLMLNCLIEDAVRFLRFTNLPSLKTLEHHFPFLPSSSMADLPWDVFLGALKNSTTSEFTSLEVNPEFSFRPSHRGREKLWEKIEAGAGVSFKEMGDSLLRLSLTTLKLDFPLFQSLSEAHFAAMGLAWPTLTTLYVRVISKRAPTPNTTILKVIRDTFPHLSQLGIDIDARRIDQPCTMTSSPNPLRSIEARLIRWEEKSTTKFTALIDSLFPQLLSFRHLPNYYSMIQMRLSDLQHARMRERNWIRSEYRMPELKQAEDEDRVVYTDYNNDRVISNLNELCAMSSTSESSDDSEEEEEEEE